MPARTFHKSQLFKGEKPTEATLPDGTKITVLVKKGFDLYTTPGRPANFGGVADTVLPVCNHFFLPLSGGRSLSLFVNTESGLICADIVNRAETGGCEIIRRTFPGIPGGREKPNFKLESLGVEG